MTEISDTVEAPERQITRCAAPMRSAMSVKNGATSAFISSWRVQPRDHLHVFGPRLLRDAQPAR